MLLAALPGVSLGADEAARLDATRKQINEIRKKLAAAKGEAGEIQKHVNALDSQIGDLNRQIRTGEHDISVLESNIRTAEARIAELEGQYLAAAEASQERARRLYKSGSADYVTALLSATSLSEFMRMTVLWEIAARSDGKVMITASRLRSELNEEREGLVEIRNDLALQKSWLEERRNLIASARHEKARALGAIQGQIRADEAHIAGLEKEARALTAVIRANLSRSTGAVSTSGFIWPHRGRITQGYTRRHPAIDIDGNTGQPIVASKAGYIGGASCSGGYGLCTIIDHGNGVSTLYAHMSRKTIYSGQVQRGQVIGYIGCSGRCTGPHLHFEVRVNGSPQNPMRFLP